MPPTKDWSAGAVETINRPSGIVHLALAVAVVIAAIAIVASFLIRVDRSVEGTAEVRPEGGTWSAQAPWVGKIAEILVGEGALVKQGDPLYRMDPTELEIRRNGLTKQRDLAEKDLENYRSRAPQAKVRGEVRVEAALAALQRSKAAENSAAIDARQAKEQHERKQDLFKSGTVPEQEVKEAKGLHEKAEATLKVAREDVAVASKTVDLERQESVREVEDLELKVRESGRFIADLVHQVEEVDQRVKEAVIRAACAGLVMRYVVRAPSVVETGMKLAEVVPSGAASMVEARVEAFQAGEIKTGQRARVRFAGRTEPVRGTVRYVSADTDPGKDRSFYKVEIQLDESKDRLPFGLKGHVTILTTRATLAQLAKEALLD